MKVQDAPGSVQLWFERGTARALPSLRSDASLSSKVWKMRTVPVSVPDNSSEGSGSAYGSWFMDNQVLTVLV